MKASINATSMDIMLYPYSMYFMSVYIQSCEIYQYSIANYFIYKNMDKEKSRIHYFKQIQLIDLKIHGEFTYKNINTIIDLVE